MTAWITVDSGNAELMEIKNSEVKALLDNITSGDRNIEVQFQCSINEQQVTLATASRVSKIISSKDSSPLTSGPNYIDFVEADYLPLIDTDKDNVSNIRELELAENPLLPNPPKTPTINISTLGASILFSSDVSDEYTATYTLLAYPRKSNISTTVASDVPFAQISTPYNGYETFNTQFVLQACNISCSDSVKFDIQQNMLDQMAYIKAFNSQNDDAFGHSVALSADGNTLAVGAYLEDGVSTYVMLPSNSDVDNAAQAAGAVYLYVRQNGHWIEDAYIKAFNSQLGDHFGVSVSLSGDGNTLAVGAEWEDGAATGVLLPTESDTANAAPDTGAVYTYTRLNNVWVEDAYIKAFNSQASDYFGNSVVISADGNTLVVGAHREDGAATEAVQSPSNIDNAKTATDSGAVYVYTRINSLWVEDAYIKAFNNQTLDEFGSSISLSADGKTLAVAARYEDGASFGVNLPSSSDIANAARDAGAVYVYTRSNTGWATNAYIKAFNTQLDNVFGYAVCLSADGNTLAVSSPTEQSAVSGVLAPDNIYGPNISIASGAVYLYTRLNDTWSEEAYIKAVNVQEGAFFGFSLALSSDGNILAVGAYGEGGETTGVQLPSNIVTTNAASSSGAMYLYSRQSNGWAEDAYIKALNTESWDNFGNAVALSADGNTLAVSATGEDGTTTGVHLPVNSDTVNGTLNSGAVYVY